MRVMRIERISLILIGIVIVMITTHCNPKGKKSTIETAVEEVPAVEEVAPVAEETPAEDTATEAAEKE